ncbi:hypothetical protein ACFXG4_07695 [Nocardia sp. NPDC059246]|uniref:hypothetical protein n=1 Tax=unclassified Nocardia TaxID=2637762 RepID=UPI0036CCF3D1
MRRAIGFVLRAASGDDVGRHEDEMMREAARLGFTWTASFFEDAHCESNYVRMVNRIIREDADAVLLPGAGHLSSQDIEVLATHCDVFRLEEGTRHTMTHGIPMIVDYR